MEKGDKVIWDSGFGYEIGFFIEESDNYMYNSYRINLTTGVVTGSTLRDKDRIIPHTEENIKQMEFKYK